MTDASTHNNVPKLLVLGIIFHVVFIASVFDCYFTSPVVQGMPRHGLGLGEAKRLVLIVGQYLPLVSVHHLFICLRTLSADGLRADLVFTPNGFPFADSPAVVAPHLRSIVEERGAFGVSHTRVPTESRPGHVAIIGASENVHHSSNLYSLAHNTQEVCTKTSPQ